MISFFIVAMILPTLFINRDPEKILSMENRRVAQFPAVFTHERLLKGFRGGFDNYLNDNIGFRELAVLTNIITKHQLFGLYSEPHVLLGSDNHLFYVPGNVSDSSTLPPYEKLSEKRLRKYMSDVLLTRDYYKERNIPFIFVTIPDKEEIYPEYYPIPFGDLPYKTRLAQVVQYINEHSDADAFDLTEDLIEAKKGGGAPLYFKNHDPAHWNMNGAFVGYRKIMERLRAYQNDLLILSSQDFVIEEVPVTKRKGAYIYNDYQDIVYNYIPRNGYSALKQDNAPVKYPSRHCYYYKNPACDNGKKLLIFGDSYIYMFIRDFFAESFSELLFCHWQNHWLNDSEYMNKAAEAFNPDFVVYEIVERTAHLPVVE
jgi:hypothetical protein